MKPSPEKEAGRWLAQAERDLDDAGYAASGRRYNLCCFLAQQAAEKAMKAYLYAHGEEEVWGHSVGELCKDASSFDVDFKTLQEAAAALDKFYIPTRYPNSLPGGIPSEVYQEKDAAEALSLSRRIIGRMKSALKDLRKRT